MKELRDQVLGGTLDLAGSSLDNSQILNKIRLPALSLLCDLGHVAFPL